VNMSVELIIAEEGAHWAAARALLMKYADSLGFDLEFQDFAQEMATLEVEYGSPRGCFILARRGDTFVGCIAARRLEGVICEMKRLYVPSEQRGKGLGRQLSESLIVQSRALGYQRMRLDTVPAMTTAQALYRDLGFRVIEPYRYNPVPGTTFMELVL